MWAISAIVDGVKQYVSKECVRLYTPDINQAVTYDSEKAAYDRYIRLHDRIMPFTIIEVELKEGTTSKIYTSIRKHSTDQICVMLDDLWVGIHQPKPSAKRPYIYYTQYLESDVNYAISFKNVKMAQRYVDQCIELAAAIQNDIQSFDEYVHSLRFQIKQSPKIYTRDKLKAAYDDTLLRMEYSIRCLSRARVVILDERK